MHNLSRRIAIALQHEERRCQYLTREAKLMLAVQDELTTMTESEASQTQTKINSDLDSVSHSLFQLFILLVTACTIFYDISISPIAQAPDSHLTLSLLFTISADGTLQSPFRQILPKCKLARDLKEAYDR